MTCQSYFFPTQQFLSQSWTTYWRRKLSLECCLLITGGCCAPFFQNTRMQSMPLILSWHPGKVGGLLCRRLAFYLSRRRWEIFVLAVVAPSRVVDSNWSSCLLVVDAPLTGIVQMALTDTWNTCKHSTSRNPSEYLVERRDSRNLPATSTGNEWMTAAVPCVAAERRHRRGCPARTDSSPRRRTPRKVRFPQSSLRLASGWGVRLSVRIRETIEMRERQKCAVGCRRYRNLSGRSHRPQGTAPVSNKRLRRSDGRWWIDGSGSPAMELCSDQTRWEHPWHWTLSDQLLRSTRIYWKYTMRTTRVCINALDKVSV